MHSIRGKFFFGGIYGHLEPAALPHGISWNDPIVGIRFAIPTYAVSGIARSRKFLIPYPDPWNSPSPSSPSPSRSGS